MKPMKLETCIQQGDKYRTHFYVLETCLFIVIQKKMENAPYLQTAQGADIKVQYSTFFIHLEHLE